MSKVNEMVKMYSDRLERKQNLVKPYHDKQNKFEELSDKEYTAMMVLEAEIRQIEEFIDDIKYMVE